MPYDFSIKLYVEWENFETAIHDKQARKDPGQGDV
jgi:hypothetical protein